MEFHADLSPSLQRELSLSLQREFNRRRPIRFVRRHYRHHDPVQGLYEVRAGRGRKAKFNVFVEDHVDGFRFRLVIPGAPSIDVPVGVQSLLRAEFMQYLNQCEHASLASLLLKLRKANGTHERPVLRMLRRLLEW